MSTYFKPSIRTHAKRLVALRSEQQRSARLTVLRFRFGAEFAEQICRYADAHPVSR